MSRIKIETMVVGFLFDAKTAFAFFLLTGVLTLACSATYAQAPFQDGTSSGSVLISDGYFIQINIADPSIRIGYLHDDEKQHWPWGVEASGKLTGTKAALLNNNRLAPDMKLKFMFGRKYVFAKRFDVNNLSDQQRLQQQYATEHGLAPETESKNYWRALPYDRLMLELTYGYKQYKLFDESAPFDEQVFKKGFHNPSVALTYSTRLNNNHLTLFGASFGVGRSNNSGDLTEVDVRDINSATFNDTVREIVESQQVLRGDFKQSTSVFLNTDYVIYPQKQFSRIGIDFYSRSNFTGIDKGFRPGIGVFLTEKGDPTKVLGGVSVSYKDGKASVALIAGFSF